jgi:hypothetical protein
LGGGVCVGVVDAVIFAGVAAISISFAAIFAIAAAIASLSFYNRIAALILISYPAYKHKSRLLILGFDGRSIRANHRTDRSAILL